MLFANNYNFAPCLSI
jgi:hypothetical protein